ncbi:MAG: glycosyl transferase family 2 [Acidobacteria bacterium]|nr:MAG: glycosyl transferase family 2 [Acidobacteriota bacterium]
MNKSRVKGLVSVITPVYNAERFLAETVDSVLAQTYTQWELLLVDDGSTDGSPMIARQYASSDPVRITCLEHPGHRNAGVCASRNLAVRQSRGEYVALLDADDIWLPEKLQQQVELMQASPEASLIYGHSIYFADGDHDAEHVPPLAPPGKLYYPPELLKLTYPLGKAGAPCPSDFLMRYELLEEIGGFEESFDPHFQLYEDQAFLAKVYLHAPVFVANECWDRYRCHNFSCSGQAERSNRADLARQFYLNWLKHYLRAKNFHDDQIWAAVKRLTWPYRHPVLAGASRVVRGAAKRMLRTMFRLTEVSHG